MEEKIRKMETAYGKLYEIENKLRQIIIRNLSESYGYNWEMKAPLKVHI